MRLKVEKTNKYNTLKMAQLWDFFGMGDSLCEYSDIYENDAISFYGLPLAISSFENRAGETTSVIMIAASHAKKAY